MDKYGEFVIVDSLAKTYGYTHDQVFDLSWREAFTMVALNREQQYIESRAAELKRQADKLK